jgi:hypothetical protein
VSVYFHPTRAVWFVRSSFRMASLAPTWDSRPLIHNSLQKLALSINAAGAVPTSNPHAPIPRQPGPGCATPKYGGFLALAVQSASLVLTLGGSPSGCRQFPEHSSETNTTGSGQGFRNSLGSMPSALASLPSIVTDALYTPVSS